MREESLEVIVNNKKDTYVTSDLVVRVQKSIKIFKKTLSWKFQDFTAY